MQTTGKSQARSSNGRKKITESELKQEKKIKQIRKVRGNLIFERGKSNKPCYRDFVEGSSESEDTSYSESSASSSESSGPDVRRPTVKKAPFIVQTKSFSVARVPIRKKSGKKDRFYDKSRDIPNDVYFGDVKGNENISLII